MSPVVTLLRGRRGALVLLLPLAIFIVLTTLLRPTEPTGRADDYPQRAENAARVRALVDQLRAAQAPVAPHVIEREVTPPPPHAPHHAKPEPCKCARPPEPEAFPEDL